MIPDEHEEAMREKTALTCVELVGGHSNIIHLNHHYNHDGFQYLVLEFIDGRNLYEYVAQQKKLTEDKGKRILHQLASALAFMHVNGIVHCDLKPQNIMISDDMTVKLIDFGSATIPDPLQSPLPLKPALRLSQAPISGTKSYWAPEMLKEKNVKTFEANMDMWALGCILFIMLSGHHPFDPRGTLSENEILRKVCEEPVKFDHSVWADVSPTMKNIISKLLDKNPETRLTSSELVEILGN
jgi:serine/threonine protein kinase